MKILLISEYFYPEVKGGGEISALMLAKGLAEEGISVHVLTSHFKGLKKEETYEGIRIHRMLRTGLSPSSIAGNIERSLFFEKSLLESLLALSKKEDFDIIHCMNATSICAVKLKRKLKAKFILHVNSPVLFCPKGTLRYKDRENCSLGCSTTEFLGCFLSSNTLGKVPLSPILKYNPAVIFSIRKSYSERKKLLGKFDHFMAISSFMEERLLKEGIDKKKVSVIYNIVELEKFKSLKIEKHSIPRILYLGEYTRPKGPHLLMRAMSILDSWGIKYEALFYGEGSLKKELEKESEILKNRIEINGKAKYSDIPGIMQKGDIVVMPSLVGEAFGRVALEAAAAGKIVIGSDAGGIKDVPGVVIFSSRDMGGKDLAEKIKEAISSKKKARIGPGNLERFEKRNVVGLVKKTYSFLAATTM